VSGKAFAAFMAVLAVVGLLAFGVVKEGERQLEVGDAAPVVDLPVLAGGRVDLRQPTASIADFRGEWVLLNVWASWCTPCEAEAPDLVDFQREHGGDGFTILGINTQDGTEDALEFVRDFGLNYPSIRDGSGDYADELGTRGVPESFLIDPEGNVAYVRAGQVDRELLDSQVLPLIQGQAAARGEASAPGNSAIE
jgi:cytochrome c biogenesis protein CcmG, thiol:disulfide interchange protein DsbE